MAQQPKPTVENHFIAGFKTEYTGLNFPENAATDTQNCVYSLIGDVTRRGGINYEANFTTVGINQSGVARSSYRWLNAGGDGSTQLLVQQIGNLLYFFRSSSATTVRPLSFTLLAGTIDIDSFIAKGTTIFPSLSECQYSSGNGYLFVYHPNCEPFYCAYNNGIITATVINIQIRDFIGIPEPGVADNFRPNTLTAEHQYNLINQGWTTGSGWTGNGTANKTGAPTLPCVGDNWTIAITSQTDTSTVTNGSQIKVNIPAAAIVGSNNNNQNVIANVLGVVNNYVAPFNTITINVGTIDYDCSRTAFGSWNGGNFFPAPNEAVTLTLVNVGFINAWFTALHNYPSNSDVWC